MVGTLPYYQLGEKELMSRQKDFLHQREAPWKRCFLVSEAAAVVQTETPSRLLRTDAKALLVLLLFKYECKDTHSLWKIHKKEHKDFQIKREKIPNSPKKQANTSVCVWTASLG